MAEKLYPNILRSGREDGVLAKTDNLYDSIQQMMQEALNAVLSKYFNFKTGNARAGSLDGGNLAAGSVTLESLSESLREVIGNSAALAQLSSQVTRLQSVTENLQGRVSDLEEGTDIGKTEEDGFFLVDSNGNIGPCVTPDFIWGFDKDFGDTPLALTQHHGGTKILVRGADFSMYEAGKLGEHVGLNYLSVDFQQSYVGSEFTLTAAPSPSTYDGGYTWRVASGSEYVRLKSQQGNAAVFEILPGASGSTVKVVCFSSVYTTVKVERTFQVTYDVPLEDVSIGIVGVLPWQNSESNPLRGKTFQMLATAVPATADISQITWDVPYGTSSVESPSNASSEAHENPCTLRIAPSAKAGSYAVVRCTVRRADGTTVQKDMQVWVVYQGDLAVDSIRIGGDYSEVTQEETQLTVVESPLGAETGVVDWAVTRGPARVSKNGLLTVTPEARTGDLIVVEATAENLSGDDSKTAVAILENQWKPVLKSLTIAEGNTVAKGKGIQLHVVAVPSLVEYSQVEWSIVTGGRYASVDALGYVSFVRGVEDVFVVVKATSLSDPSVSASVELQVAYDDSGRDITWLSQVGHAGGEYVDFTAMGHTARALDGSSPVAADEVVWSIVKGDASSSGGSVKNGLQKATASGIKSAGPVSGGLRFSTEDGHKNRLLLDAEAAGVQGVTVRCALVADASIYRDEYYEFTYAAGKVPLTGLLMDVSEITAPVANKWYTMRDEVRAVPDNALFDREKVVFAHTNTDACYLGYGGRMAVNEGVVGATDVWTVGYPLLGEDQLHPTGRIQLEKTMLLTRLSQEITAKSIRILHEDQYAGEVSGQPVDGGQLRVVDQDGNEVRDQNGNVVKATFAVVSGGDYCSINGYGYDLRIFDTGGAWKQVTVKAVVKDLVATATFEVKV